MHFILSSERKKRNCRGRSFDRWNFEGGGGFECDLDISSQPLIKFGPLSFQRGSSTGQKIQEERETSTKSEMHQRERRNAVKGKYGESKCRLYSKSESSPKPEWDFRTSTQKKNHDHPFQILRKDPSFYLDQRAQYHFKQYL